MRHLRRRRVVGDYLCQLYGPLAATPMTITIANNRIVACTSHNTQLQDDFGKYTTARKPDAGANSPSAPTSAHARDRPNRQD